MNTALTGNFKTTVSYRASSDPKFRKRMLIEAVNEMLAGNLGAGKSMLRDYINATITFEGLAEKLGKSSKSMHRMPGPKGNPGADNMLEIIRILQEHEHLRLRGETNRAA